MAVSTIEPNNWWGSNAPSEMDSATLSIGYIGSSVISLTSYIGSTVFYISQQVTRRYDLASQMHIGPYIQGINNKNKGTGLKIIQVRYDHRHAVKYNDITMYAYAVLMGNEPSQKTTGFPPVWASAPWGSTTVLDPGEDMSKQIAKNSEADDLVNMLSGTHASGPATDPPEPIQRVPEGDPSNSKIAPHRRSVIKGLREPKAYLSYLSK